MKIKKINNKNKIQINKILNKYPIKIWFMTIKKISKKNHNKIIRYYILVNSKLMIKIKKN